MKQFCYTHRFFFEGVCPFCSKDSIANVVKKYSVSEKPSAFDKKKPKNTDKEITDNDLENLRDVFASKFASVC